MSNYWILGRKIENPFLKYLKLSPKDSKILLIILHTCVEAAPCIRVQPKTHTWKHVKERELHYYERKKKTKLIYIYIYKLIAPNNSKY